MRPAKSRVIGFGATTVVSCWPHSPPPAYACPAVGSRVSRIPKPSGLFRLELHGPHIIPDGYGLTLLFLPMWTRRTPLHQNNLGPCPGQSPAWASMAPEAESRACLVSAPYTITIAAVQIGGLLREGRGPGHLAKALSANMLQTCRADLGPFSDNNTSQTSPSCVLIEKDGSPQSATGRPLFQVRGADVTTLEPDSNRPFGYSILALDGDKPCPVGVCSAEAKGRSSVCWQRTII
jgi:hypothetical protein